MASVRQKGTRLQVQIRIAGHPPETRYFPLEAEQEARAWAEAREAELGGAKSQGGRKASPTSPTARGKAAGAAEGTPGHTGTPGYPMTLRDALKRYEREVTPTKKGAHQEHGRIRLWLKEPLADKRLVDITAIDLTEWRKAEEAKPSPGGKPRSPSTVRNKINLISAVYRYARSEWAMPDLQNPVSAVLKPKQRRGRDVRLTQAQRDTFWKATQTPRRGKWVFFICKLASLTAMRQGELLAATWENWRGGNVLHLPDTKNGSARDVPLSTEALTVLKAWHSFSGKPGTGPIFPHTANAVQQAHREVVEYIRRRLDPRFPHLTFHDLRHLAATDLSKKLTNVLELSAVTGHRSVQVLKRYYNPDASDLAVKLG